MHCKSIFRAGALLITVSMLFAAACTPNATSNIADDDDNGGYASDASRIEWANNDVISICDAAGSVYNGAYLRTTGNTLGTCATVGTDTTHTPHTLTIRFGPTDCVCLDGRKRRGTIVVSYNGRYNDTAQTHTINFDNYYINGNRLTGTIKTIRIDTTVLGNWYYSVLANDSMNISPDPLKSMFVVWKGNLLRRWVQGNTVPNTTRQDDVFSISGTATLTRPNGHTFTCAISSPLQFATNCDFCQAGVVDVTGYTPPVRVLNYGFGGCDAAADLNLNNAVYKITLTK
ncbi:MAG: hypothetical protein K0Q79_2643 [Flavipsychrobacter sp.]|nr:hypothetical protein [Flavipsychrobacter sp.]